MVSWLKWRRGRGTRRGVEEGVEGGGGAYQGQAGQGALAHADRRGERRRRGCGGLGDEQGAQE